MRCSESKAREAVDLTVPAEMRMAAAIWVSLKSSQYRSTSTSRCRAGRFPYGLDDHAMFLRKQGGNVRTWPGFWFSNTNVPSGNCCPPVP